ncbi:MAG: P1 family peptidase, partial [Planctomycetes bacterium]|nr:P1 family peptidase [Planctomycetota bacterium]
PHFWAGAFERDAEFGGLGPAPRIPPEALAPRGKHAPQPAAIATTPAIVATDARLDKASARRFAMMAQDGMARALYPVHTPVDGDTVFALASGDKPVADPVADMIEIGTEAANCLARAIARAVFEAGRQGAGASTLPAWRDRFG